MYKAEYHFRNDGMPLKNGGMGLLIARFDFRREVIDTYREGVERRIRRGRLNVEEGELEHYRDLGSGELARYLFEKEGLRPSLTWRQRLRIGNCDNYPAFEDKNRVVFISYPFFRKLVFKVEVGAKKLSSPLEKIFDLNALDRFVLTGTKTYNS